MHRSIFTANALLFLALEVIYVYDEHTLYLNRIDDVEWPLVSRKNEKERERDENDESKTKMTAKYYTFWQWHPFFREAMAVYLIVELPNV